MSHGRPAPKRVRGRRVADMSEEVHRVNDDDVLVEQALEVIGRETPLLFDKVAAITKAVDDVRAWMPPDLRRDLDAAVMHLDDAMFRLWRVTSSDE